MQNTIYDLAGNIMIAVFSKISNMSLTLVEIIQKKLCRFQTMYRNCLLN